MTGRLATRLGLVLALGALWPAALAARDVPANEGWVTDLAGFLSAAQEQDLEDLMESYKQGSGHEIALLTVPSLEGASLEGFALDVAREWGLGSEETNNGALLIVARDERKLRIEVGRGLEGDLPDVIASRVIRDVITPLFKQGRMAEGLRAGVEAMHAAIGGDYAPLERGRRRGSGAPMGFGLLVLVMVLLMFVGMGRRHASAHRGRRGSLAGPLLWWTVLGAGGRGGWGGGGGRGGGFGGGGFSGFGGGGGFSGGGASGGW